MSDMNPETGVSVTTDKELVGEFVANHIPHIGRASKFGQHIVLGFVHGSELVAGVVYNNYKGFDVDGNIASITPVWSSKETWRLIFSVPFEELKCQRMTVVTGKGNKRARDLIERLGFVMEGVAKRGLDGYEDAVRYGMLKADCRWL